MRVNDEDGSLAKVARAFESANIGIKNVLKKSDEGEIVFVTDETTESRMNATLEQIRALSCTEDVPAVVRVEN